MKDLQGNIEILRNAVEGSVESGGRARRAVIQALEELEVRQDCLLKLAAKQGQRAEESIRRLIITCDRAIEELVLTHLSFMRRETAKMAKADEDAEELFQEAYFGLRRASERFDPERGVRFYLYALLWIRQRVSRWRADQGSMIRVPVHRVQLNTKIAAHAEEFERAHARSPTDLELAAGAGCAVWTIRSLALALSDPIPLDNVSANMQLCAMSPEDYVRRKQADILLSREIDQLNDREQDIIRRRFGINRDSDMTLEEVGKVYGVTRERIRQIESKALKRMKQGGRKRFLRELF